eukprot:3490690-Pyramimonas_sp.AAC.1
MKAHELTIRVADFAQNPEDYLCGEPRNRNSPSPSPGFRAGLRTLNNPTNGGGGGEHTFDTRWSVHDPFWLLELTVFEGTLSWFLDLFVNLSESMVSAYFVRKGSGLKLPPIVLRK